MYFTHRTGVDGRSVGLADGLVWRARVPRAFATRLQVLPQGALYTVFTPDGVVGALGRIVPSHLWEELGDDMVFSFRVSCITPAW